ncbi:MAG: carbohydrate binding domain-containing protein [Verrucomicrobiota bacterium]
MATLSACTPIILPESANRTGNGSFEEGEGSSMESWTSTHSSPPVRTDAKARSGNFSVCCTLGNKGKQPEEGQLSQVVAVDAGKTYSLSFWSLQTHAGPSYVQQYAVRWLGASNQSMEGGPGLVSFESSGDTWGQTTAPGLTAPPGAAAAEILFRFVTGAVKGGSGEVFLDDVLFTETRPAP